MTIWEALYMFACGYIIAVGHHDPSFGARHGERLRRRVLAGRIMRRREAILKCKAGNTARSDQCGNRACAVRQQSGCTEGSEVIAPCAKFIPDANQTTWSVQIYKREASRSDWSALHTTAPRAICMAAYEATK